MEGLEIFFEKIDNFNVSSYPTLENCLFEALKFTKNGIRFNRHGSFSFGNGVGKM